MGHHSSKTSKERLNVIKEHVSGITAKIKTNSLVYYDKYRYRETLKIYSEELELILNKNLKRKHIKEVEFLIGIAIEELNKSSHYDSTHHSVDRHDPQYKLKIKVVYLKILNEINEDLQKIKSQLTLEHFKRNQEMFRYDKLRLDEIEYLDEDVEERKSQISIEMSKLEPVLLQIKIDKDLNYIEKKHYQSRLDIEKFTEMVGSDRYNEQLSHLVQLKNDASQIRCGSKVEDTAKKDYILFNIENNIQALKFKAHDNQVKLGKSIQEEVYTSSNEKLINSLVLSFSQFEKMYSPSCISDEIKAVHNQLCNVKMRLDQKTKEIGHQAEFWETKNPRPPRRNRTIRRASSLQVPGNQPPQRPNPDSFNARRPISTNVEFPGQNLAEASADSYVAIGNNTRMSLTSAESALLTIMKSVKNIYEEIFHIKFDKQSHMYMDRKLILEDFKVQLNNMARQDHQNLSQLKKEVMEYTDKVYTCLENNTPYSKNTPEDFYDVILFIDSKVDNLRGQVENNNRTLQEYCRIENKLYDHFYYLNALPISSRESDHRNFRDSVQIKIQVFLSYLERLKQEHSDFGVTMRYDTDNE